MKLSVLSENTASGRCGAEHGLSYLIESDMRILFDTGHSDLFRRNAKQMCVSLDDLDAIVLSHGHWDHGDGLAQMGGQKLICHPGAFMKRYRAADHSYIGLSMGREEARERFCLIESRGPVQLSPAIWFLGEVPRLTGFEAKHSTFVDENGKPDYVPDDSALAVVEDGQLTLISGCAHAGICNTLEHAMKITGARRVKAILGGFHLKTAKGATTKTINFLKTLHVQNVWPSHCTQLPALCAFHQSFGGKHIKAGMAFDI